MDNDCKINVAKDVIDAGFYNDQSQEMIELYQKLAPEYLVDLNEAQDNGDINAIKFQAHKLNSMMGIMGLTPISDVLKQLCHMEDDIAAAAVMVSQVNKLTESSLEILSSR